MIDTMTHMHGACLGGVAEVVVFLRGTLFGASDVAVICLWMQLISPQLHCSTVLHMTKPTVWLVMASMSHLS